MYISILTHIYQFIPLVTMKIIFFQPYTNNMVEPKVLKDQLFNIQFLDTKD